VDEPGPRLVVLAVAGLDTPILDDLIARRKLPNLARLHRTELSTTTPADPAVAWAGFATGAEPAAHGIVGETVRAPGEYVAGDARVAGSNVLAEEPFWLAASRQGKRVRVLRAPSAFPPARMAAGEVLSGPGTPDLLGDGGTYILVRSAGPAAPGGDPEGGLLITAERMESGGWRAAVPGPQIGGVVGHAEVVFEVDRSADGGGAILRVDGGAEQVTVSAGQWSSWLELSFGAGDDRVRGITRVLPVSLLPDLVLLMEPPGADPWAPSIALSSPRYYAGFLADRYGRYRTSGRLVDARAYSAGVMDLPSLLRQTYASWEQQERMTLGEFGRGGWDLFVSVFPQPGPAVQILARAGDEDLPARDADVIEAYGEAVGKLYALLDGMVGEIMKGLGAEDRLILVGVRGIRPVRRTVNLTAWLVKERYSVLARKARTSVRDDFEDYDWQATRAWAAGAGGICLNLEGREPSGIVGQGQEAEDLLEEIRMRLLAWRDGGRPVVREVLAGGELFKGPAAGRAPDLLVLLHPGYGVGPAGLRGAVPARVLEDSTALWVPFADGAHPADARGVLMTTFTPRGDPSVLDIAPTVLGFFGIKPPPSCSGRDLW
jgi:predicted AlkP superfamily phosphohydrolase/phosphomutase